MRVSTQIKRRPLLRPRPIATGPLRCAWLAWIVFTSPIAMTAAADSTFLLEIDSGQSEITQNCLSGCGQGEPGRGPFSIGGRFQLIVWDADLGFGNVDLVDVSVETEEAPDPVHLFAFPAINAALDGEELTGNADYCYWAQSSPGTCSSAGRLDHFSGTFDGHSLQIMGIDYQTLHNKPSYSYAIAANVVPEPSSALGGAMVLYVFASMCRTRGESASA